MFKLSDKPTKEEYKTHNGKDVLLGELEVQVILDCVDTKSGSWEHGFKFGSITYGILKRKVKKKYSWSKTTHDSHEFSADHGKTWHECIKGARKSKGKVIIDRMAPRGEFAFDLIQNINREYYGQDYKWKP